MKNPFSVSALWRAALRALNGQWSSAAILIIPCVVFLVAQGAIQNIARLLARTGNPLGILFLFGWVLVTFLLFSQVIVATRFLFYDVARGRPAKGKTLLEPFRKYGRYVEAYFAVNIRIFLWSLLLIVPGIIKAVAYSQTYYILRENPSMDTGDALACSEELMEGHKGEYFLLVLTFVPLFIAGALLFQIPALWVYPTYFTACGRFFDELKRDYRSREQDRDVANRPDFPG